MNTIPPVTKSGAIDEKKAVNLSRAGKAIVKSGKFDLTVQVKKYGSNFRVVVEDKVVYGGANTAFDAWQWMKEYLNIKN